MTKNKSIRILSPDGGWLTINNGYRDESLDTGFGNRLMYWLSIYNLNEISRFKYQLLVEEPWWPELKIIDLPNTDVFRYEFNVFEDLSSQWIREQRKFLYNKNEMCGLLTKSKLKRIRKNINILLEKDNWITYFPYEARGEYFPKIKFKNKVFDNYIKPNIENTIGVHYRRGSGISLPELDKKFTDKDGNYGIVKIQDLKISKWKRKNSVELNDTTFIPNEYYFKILDDKIKTNPNLKIYLSYDVPKEFIFEFQVRYKNRLITHEDYIDKVTSELEKDKIYFDKWPYDNVIRTMIDFYVLLNTEDFIPHPLSSWSHIIDISKNENKIL